MKICRQNAYEILRLFPITNYCMDTILSHSKKYQNSNMYKQESINIVIADDSEVVRKTIKKTLSELPGVKVTGCASNASATVKLVEEIKPDAVILGIKMPGEGGLEVLKKIKETNPRIVVIIFTNYPSTQYKAMCYRYGADYFFDRSMEFQLLTDVFNEMALGHFYYIYN